MATGSAAFAITLQRLEMQTNLHCSRSGCRHVREASVDSTTAAVVRAAEYERHRLWRAGLDAPSTRLLDPAGRSDSATHTAACIGQVWRLSHDPGRGEADVPSV